MVEPSPGRESDALDVDVNRLGAFSDGVFAIAATLLILEVHVPALDEDVVESLRNDWPMLLAVAISFVVIGIAWIHHHNLFHHVERVDRPVLIVNLFLLLFTSAMPLSTAILGEHLTGSQQRVSTMLYCLSLSLVSAMFLLLWVVLCHNPRLLRPGTYQQALAARRHGVMALGGYLVAAACALLAPAAALAVIGGFVCYFLVGRNAPTARTKLPVGEEQQGLSVSGGAPDPGFGK